MNLDQLARSYDHHAEQARAFLDEWEHAGRDSETLLAAHAHAQLAHGLAVLMAGAELSLSR